MNKTWFSGDINWQTYGGKWYKQVSDVKYHVIELINMWDSTGDESEDKYNASLQEIDLMEVSEDNIKSALSCCGWENTSNLCVEMVVESLSDYGLYAPMGNWNGNNYSKLLSLARKESRQLVQDDNYHDSMINRVVNRMGSTALEYSRGDMQSALLRGIKANNKISRLLGKIYGLTEKDMDNYRDS